MSGQIWEVVGGTDKGGIVVRAGRELSSQQLEHKLATASKVTQLARAGDRLRYRLLDGQGPEEGWVSVRMKDRELLRPCKEPASAPAAAPPSSASSREAPPQLPKQPGTSGTPERQPLKKADTTSSAERRPEASETQQEEQQRQLPRNSRAADAAAPPNTPQLTVPEATRLQDQLREGFGAKDFQDGLRALQRRYPQRKQRGHAHGAAYFEAFEALVLTVFCRVLPRFGLSADWGGVQDMHSRMATALRNHKVRKQQEELNTLLGLPRDAVLSPSKKVEEAFVYREDRDGGVPGPPVPLLADEDGDEAHEFFVEDPDTGEFRSTLAAAECKPFGV